jgi:quercetin dioxygenase-like cupin family protein
VLSVGFVTLNAFDPNQTTGLSALHRESVGAKLWRSGSESVQSLTMSNPIPSKPTGLAAATVVAAADLAQYQEGAIVSREVVRKPAGGVTTFAFDAGERLSEHIAPFDALVHVLEGEAEIRVSGQPYRVRAGEMILMPANQPHAVEAVQQFRMLLTMIRS